MAMEVSLAPKSPARYSGENGLPFWPRLNSAQRKRSGGVTVDLGRFLHLPVSVAEADEDEMVAVQADAEKRVQGVALLVLQAAEAALDLLDDLLAAGGVGAGPMRAPASEGFLYSIRTRE